jgi:GDP-L-fucose synthase
MVGSALIRRLTQEDCRVLTVGRDAVDLRDQVAVDRWFDEHRPEAVLLAAARVGGIHENDTHPGDFLYDNLAIATNVIEASRRTGVAKLLFLGSSCIYPRLAPQPMPESCLLTGPLEATNQWYAIAKIAGLKLCQAYRRQHGFQLDTFLMYIGYCTSCSVIFSLCQRGADRLFHILTRLVGWFYECRHSLFSY